MPELPEVETTKNGIIPFLDGESITAIVLHTPKLRFAIPKHIDHICGATIESINRRGKYIIIQSQCDYILIHLGMSGSLRITDIDSKRRKHDHVEFFLSCNKVLRYNDPRRFGCVLWQQGDPLKHPLLSKLGPEPLENDFDADYLINRAKGRKKAIKALIMDGHIVVGVGNIYASESLFRAGIRPGKSASRVTQKELTELTLHIKQVLTEAIEQGGTTLKDFSNASGKPGYFAQKLAIYGRKGEKCYHCKSEIKVKTIAQRASYYCPSCQS